MNLPVLSVRNLKVEFVTRRGILRAIDDISFDIAPGEVLGMVGESGAGKSLTGTAIIGLIDPPGRISGGEILLSGKRIDNLQEEELRKIRGKRIGMIFQDPLTSLNPIYKISEQLVEKKLCRDRGTAVMLVTHDMGVIAETADRVAVIYAGRIVEIGSVREVVQRAKHPYASGLMGAIPTLEAFEDRLVQIPGAMPRLNAIPSGCAFNPRCSRVFDRCFQERPGLMPVGSSMVACWHYADGRKGVAA